MPGKWISNLESDALIALNLTLAKASCYALLNSDDEHAKSVAQANLTLAQIREQGHENTMSLLAREHPGFIIAKPQKTRMKSATQIESEGYVGIYEHS